MENVSYKTIGQNIRTARKSNHLTQEQAAEKLGISLLHYGRLERGERNISLTQLAKTAEALHVPFSVLLEGCNLDLKSDTLQSVNRLSACSDRALRLIDDVINVIVNHEQEHGDLC